jgi:hypothetical protein
MSDGEDEDRDDDPLGDSQSFEDDDYIIPIQSE